MYDSFFFHHCIRSFQIMRELRTVSYGSSRCSLLTKRKRKDDPPSRSRPPTLLSPLLASPLMLDIASGTDTCPCAVRTIRSLSSFPRQSAQTEPKSPNSAASRGDPDQSLGLRRPSRRRVCVPHISGSLASIGHVYSLRNSQSPRARPEYLKSAVPHASIGLNSYPAEAPAEQI